MSLTQNIMTTLSARVATLGLMFISSIVLARSLGPEGRGLFTLVLLLPELARSFGLLGFEQANAVYAGLEPGKRRALVWQSAVVAALAGGAIAGISAYFLARAEFGLGRWVHGPLWLYLLPLSLVPVQLLTEYWGAVLRGMNRIFMLNVVEVGTKIAALILVVMFVGWLRLDVAGAVWAHTVVQVGAAGLLVVLLARVGIWGWPVFDKSLWKRTGRFAFPAYLASVTSYLNYRIDQFFIAALLPPEQLGFYVIAVGLAEQLWVPTGSVANALLPHLTNSRERAPALAAVIARHMLIWTGIACLCLFALAGVIVKTLYSAAFGPAVAPLRWLLPGIFTLTIGKVLVAELIAREKIHYTLLMGVTVALVNVIGNLVLIPLYGISGAAFASSVSYTVLSFMVIWFYVKETGTPWTALLPRRSDVLVYVALWHRAFIARNGVLSRVEP